MESQKTSVFSILFIIIFIITTLVASGIAIHSNKNIEKLEQQITDLQNKINTLDQTEENNENDKQEPTENLSEAKELISTNEDKIQCNSKIRDNQTFLQIIVGSKTTYSSNGSEFNSGKFNDSEKLSILATTGSDEDKEKYYRSFENSPRVYIQKSYINERSNKLFGEEINYYNVSNEVNDTEVLSSLPTGLGIYIYKVTSLILNEKTGIYSLTFDSITPKDITTNMEKLSEYLQPEKTTYASSEIDNTYILKYKIVDGEYMLLSLDRTYSK